MRSLLVLSPLGLVLLSQAACLDQGFSILNQEPWVQIDTPDSGSELAVGLSAPVFEASVEDDKTETLALSLVWTLADGTVLDGENAVDGTAVGFTVFDALTPGQVELTLTATDDRDQDGTDTVIFTVVQGAEPIVTFDSPLDGEFVALGTDVVVALTVTDTDADDLTSLALAWDTDSAAAGAPNAPDSAGAAGWTLTAPAEGDHTVRVTATDTSGLSGDGSVAFTVLDPDADGDGFTNSLFGGDDCDDDDERVNPDALEACNGVDDDCDTDIDEDAGDRTDFFPDSDGDTYGDTDAPVLACESPKNHVSVPGDCNDADAAINPDAEEVCDGADNDCDGTIDGPDATDAGTWYVDADNDGYGDVFTPVSDCAQPSGTVADDTDCDDGISEVNPGHAEICDSLDNDCNGSVDDNATDAPTWYADTDADGFGDASIGTTICDQPSNTVADDTDCDDAEAAVNPAATEICNDVDDNCDGTIDEDTASDASTWYADTDGDSYGDPASSQSACDQPSNTVADDQDCLDTDATVNPDGVEICNGLDDNCDGTVDEDTATDAGTWYADTDGDRYGDPDASSQACSAPTSTVADNTDCDDTDAAINPAATEVCNGVDDNCDGTIDEDTAADAGTWYADLDGDGFGDPGTSSSACSQPSNTASNFADCDDTDATISPSGTEICDSLDNDCDGNVDEFGAADAPTWYADTDADGHGDPDDTRDACSAPSGYIADTGDCDDTDSAVSPDATELCDTIDNDCDTVVDEDGAADATTWFADTDGDNYGDPDTSSVSCSAPSQTVADNTDCNDTNFFVNPAATERCNGADDNCNGDIDEDTAVDAGTWYADADGDGYGDPGGASTSCAQPTDTTTDNTDCDDANAAINPAATEICDGDDNDCDAAVDENSAADATTWYLDSDADGFGDATSTWVSCEVPSGYDDDDQDCDDGDAAVNPDATEVCDSVDNDCDTTVDEDGAADTTRWYTDDDGDGFGDESDSGAVSCDPGSGFSTDNTDCDDAESTTFPGADETCDSVDSDCDSVVDEDALDGSWWQVDDDGDGLGDPVVLEWACDGVTNDWDCDDTTASEPQVVDIATGSGGAAGSLASPWDTVQAGIDNANQCVLVLPGTYVENLDFGGRNLTVESTEGSATTTLDGSGAIGPVVSIASGETDAVLRGFELTGGTGAFSSTSNSYSCSSAGTCTDYFDTWWGGGLYVDGASMLLDDLLIHVNTLPSASTVFAGDETFYTYSFGGGVAVLSGDVVAYGVHVQGNFADQGGGIYVDAASTAEWITARIAGNSARDGAGVQVDGGSSILTNVLVVDNTAPNGCGGGVQGIGGGLTLTNVTVGLNVGRNGDGLCLTTGTTSVVNSVVVYGDGGGDGVLDDGTSSHTQTYSTVYGFTTNYSGLTDPTGIDGNLSGDPLFISVIDDSDFTNDNWNPDPASPTLDAGDPDPAFNDADGTVNDQGAYGGPFGDW